MNLRLLLISVLSLWGPAAVPSPLYTCYDVLFYGLECKLDPDTKRIAGTSRIRLRAVQPAAELQVDLDRSLRAVRVTLDGLPVSFQQIQDSLRVRFPARLRKGLVYTLEILYAGAPGHGAVWQQDPRGAAWISLQGPGMKPSGWWPLKDRPEDLADSMQLAVIVQAGPNVAANGSLLRIEEQPGNFRRWVYRYADPLGGADLRLGIGDYRLVRETHRNAEGAFELRYFALTAHQMQGAAWLGRIRQAISVLERRLGPCSALRSGLTWVESPLAPGLPEPDPVEEAAALWFGRMLRAADPADQPMIAGLREYAGLLYLEESQGLEQAEALLRTQPAERYLASRLFHTLRMRSSAPSVWSSLLRSLPRLASPQGVSGETIMQVFSDQLGQDYVPWFIQYLYVRKLPVLEYYYGGSARKPVLAYRWQADTDGFNLPVEVRFGEQSVLIIPEREWKALSGRNYVTRNASIEPPWQLFEVQEVPRP
jgi:aminopeptidase N